MCCFLQHLLPGAGQEAFFYHLKQEGKFLEECMEKENRHLRFCLSSNKVSLIEIMSNALIPLLSTAVFVLVICFACTTITFISPFFTFPLAFTLLLTVSPMCSHVMSPPSLLHIWKCQYSIFTLNASYHFNLIFICFPFLTSFG